MNNSIFVAIASFLDYEVVYTILDCINKASSPDNLHFSICLQYDSNANTSENILDTLENKYNIQIEKYHYSESEGGCWARQIAQKNYNNETFSLQVDSHTRFIQDWDKIIIRDYNTLVENGHSKPLLTFLPPPYSRNDEAGIDYDFKHLYELDKLNIPKFKRMSTEYWLEYVGYGDEKNINFTPTEIKILYGGFVFSSGEWVKEVEQDPEHYYTGEELALAIRSYTHGYSLYTPSQIVAWHRAHRKPLPKHYSIHEEEVGRQKHKHAMKRLYKLIHKEDLGKYGLGTIRTLEEYENFAKLNFKLKQVVDE